MPRTSCVFATEQGITHARLRIRSLGRFDGTLGPEKILSRVVEKREQLNQFDVAWQSTFQAKFAGRCVFGWCRRGFLFRLNPPVVTNWL